MTQFIKGWLKTIRTKILYGGSLLIYALVRNHTFIFYYKTPKYAKKNPSLFQLS